MFFSGLSFAHLEEISYVPSFNRYRSLRLLPDMICFLCVYAHLTLLFMVKSSLLSRLYHDTFSADRCTFINLNTDLKALFFVHQEGSKTIGIYHNNN